MTIDWSKAPEGYDFHFQPKSRRDVGGFYTIGKTRDRFVSQSGSYILFIDMPSVTDLFHVTSRPDPIQPWSGEGLPPVGPLEYKSNSGWSRGKCVAVEDGYAVIWINCGMIFAVSIHHKNELRPIRTPEQIAAEERKKGIEQFIQDMKKVNGNGFYSHAEDLYDMGYRKCP